MNIIKLIFDLFSNKHDPAAEKERLLKENFSKLKSNPYNYFYNHHKNLYTPQLAKYIYSIYSITFFAKAQLKSLSKSEEIKKTVIEYYVKDTLDKYLNNIEPSNVLKMIETNSSDDIKKYIEDGYEKAIIVLSNDTLIKNINLTYNTMLAFVDFINIDFVSFLRKFDSAFKGTDLNYNPVFSTTLASGSLDFLDDFIFSATRLIKTNEWSNIFEILTNYRNSQIIDLSAWKYVFEMTQKVVRSNFFTLFLRHKKREPFFDIIDKHQSVDIVRNYLQDLNIKVTSALSEVDNHAKQTILNNVIVSLFPSSELPNRLKNYGKLNNVVLFKNAPALDGFIYADILNVLVVFHETCLANEFRPLVDFLIMKGVWVQNSLYKDLSSSLHNASDVTDDIIKFDSSYSNDTVTMKRLLNAINHLHSDKASLNTARGILADVNDKAYAYIKSSLQIYIILLNFINSYLDDYERTPHCEIIINWKDLEKEYPTPLKETMLYVYDKIKNLVSTLNSFSN